MKALKDWNIHKTSVISLASIFSIIILMAILLGVFEELHAWQQMVAAMLSVAATIAITGILLAYQSKQQSDLDTQQRDFEVKNEKQTKIFEEKLNIYQDFLDTLYSVLEDGVVTPAEALKLKFKISSIALHTKSERIVVISEQIEKIFRTIFEHKREQSLRSEDIDLKELLTIVNQFKMELYNEEAKFDVDNEFKQAIEKFRKIDDTIFESPKQLDDIEHNEQEEVPVSIVDQFAFWDTYANNYGWLITSDNTHPLIVSKSNIEMKIEKDENGWYFMVSSPFCSRDVYLHIRRLCGGSFISSMCWYLYFSEQYKDMNSSQLRNEVKTNDAFKNYLTNYFLRILPILDKIAFLKDNVYAHMDVESEKWRSWLYLDEGFCLANDYGDEKGHPFIDVVLQDNESIRIELSLRDEGEGKLNEYLNSIHVKDERTDKSTKSKERWSKEYSSAEEAIIVLNSLISKIEGCTDFNNAKTTSFISY